MDEIIPNLHFSRTRVEQHAAGEDYIAKAWAEDWLLLMREREQAREHNSRLRDRFSLTRTSKLEAALNAVEWVTNENGDEACPWCGGLSPREFDASSTTYRNEHPLAFGHHVTCLRRTALEL